MFHFEDHLELFLLETQIFERFFFYIISNNIIISDLMFGKREDEGIPLYSLQQAEMNIYIYIVKFIYALRLELFFKISL